MNQEALKITSIESNKKDLSHKIEFSSSCIGKPTPIDFDAFVPWICLEMQVPYDITVLRTIQEPYISRHKHHSHAKSVNEMPKRSVPSIKVSKHIIEDSIPVTACYDSKSHLTEIAIIGSPFEIPRKLIIAFTLCLPFHTSLNKISIQKGTINVAAIKEIGKLLPHSNITNIFIEDCNIQEANYHVLLENIHHLKNLALRRLGLNDVDCANIVDKLDVGQPASKTLLTLDLTSNKITDKAARAFGDILRRNRCLLHLNLCDNNISDGGAVCILKSLIPFPLSEKEIVDKKHRRLQYLIKRIEFYKQCKDDLLLHQNHADDKENKHGLNKRHEAKKHMPLQKGSAKTSKKNTSSSIVTSASTINDLADKITRDNIGEFKDVFDDDNLIIIKKELNSIGNLRLCSLNLAYNNIGYITVRKIYEILKYQSNALPKKTQLCTGLMRIVFEGNNLPRFCEEYKDISVLLEKVILENSELHDSTHHAPSLKSSRRLSTFSGKRMGRSLAHI